MGGSQTWNLMNVPHDVRTIILEMYARDQHIVLPIVDLFAARQSMKTPTVADEDQSAMTWVNYWILQRHVKEILRVSKQFRNELVHALLRNAAFEFRYEKMLRCTPVPYPILNYIRRITIKDSMLAIVCGSENITLDLIAQTFPSLTALTVRTQWGERWRHDRDEIKMYLNDPASYTIQLEVTIRGKPLFGWIGISILPNRTVHLNAHLEPGRVSGNHVQNMINCIPSLQELDLELSSFKASIAKAQTML